MKLARAATGPGPPSDLRRRPQLLGSRLPVLVLPPLLFFLVIPGAASSSLEATLAGRSDAQTGITPVGKVVELLNGMLGKAEGAKHEEQVQFAAFKQFCSDVSAEKERSVAEADSQLELLRAKILKCDTEADRLALEVRGHEGEMTSWRNDTRAAEEVRTAEQKDYSAMHINVSESITALTQAIAVLKAQSHDRAGTMAMLQKVRSLDRMPRAVGRAIQAFLARSSEDPDLTFVPANEVPVTAYEFRSTDIVKLLEQLKDKFRDELVKLDKEEVSRSHAYNVLVQDLANSIKAAEEARTSKLQSQAKYKQLSSDHSSDVQDISATRDDDAKYLKDLVATCQQKSEDFDSRQKLRKEEIEALEKAVDILSSSAVAGAAVKHLPALLQGRSRLHGTALLQLRIRGASGSSPEQLRAAAFLRDASTRLGSKVLSAIAMHAGEDPFLKVKQLIQELLDRLMMQSTAEAEHKGWCDTELATNAHTRRTKTELIEELRSEIDSLKAAVAQLSKDITQLSVEIAEIEAAVGNATDLRRTERAENNATVVDAQEAQAAVVSAVRLLKDFFSKAADATALVQVRGHLRQEPPPIFDSPYKGLQAESDGLLGMLEVIQSDFARLESDTTAAEMAAQSEYDGFMTDSSVSKVQKETDVKHMKSERKEKDAAALEKGDDLITAEQELSSAQASYEKLRPACLDLGQSYGERVSRRKEEIEALKEALRILSGGEELSLLQRQ